MLKRYLMIVEGQVQGVGFRAFCMRAALARNISGSASNLDNGNVEIIMQGEQEKIDEMIHLIIQGNRFICVSDYSIKELPLDPHLSRFTYGYGSYF